MELDAGEPRRLLAYSAPLVAYAAWRTVRPLRYLTHRIESLVLVLFAFAFAIAEGVGYLERRVDYYAATRH